jgi:hypothetical protein
MVVRVRPIHSNVGVSTNQHLFKQKKNNHVEWAHDMT